jgi:hypothetical protein
MSQRLSARIAPFDRIGDSGWNRNAIEERSLAADGDHDTGGYTIPTPKIRAVSWLLFATLAPHSVPIVTDRFACPCCRRATVTEGAVTRLVQVKPDGLSDLVV